MSFAKRKFCLPRWPLLIVAQQMAFFFAHLKTADANAILGAHILRATVCNASDQVIAILLHLSLPLQLQYLASVVH